MTSPPTPRWQPGLIRACARAYVMRRSLERYLAAQSAPLGDLAEHVSDDLIDSGGLGHADQHERAADARKGSGT